MKRYFIRTFGCQMNVADSEAMAGILAARGMQEAARPEEADVIVVNTCTIRSKAEEKAFSELGRMLRCKRSRGGAPVVVAAGCVSKQEGERMLARLPGLDILIGPRRIHRLGELLDLRLSVGKAVADFGDAPAPGRVDPLRYGVTAFVTIMQGCGNHCAYCVVPGVRGPETSRPPGDIEREVASLADRGFREVTLLGQNVNSYGAGLDGSVTFPDLLERLDRRTGIARLRFTTSHPKDFTRELVEAVRDLSSVCEWVHLPVQAGSDRVLEAMNRRYTAAEYRGKADMLREAVPGVSLSTDIIVGYPGEEGEDFDRTLDLVGTMGYSSLFAFKFSRRKGTPAWDLPDTVPAAEKDRRLQAVLALQKRITMELNRGEVGRTVEVLAEGTSRQGGGLLSGRTRGNRVVNFPGADGLVGTLVPVLVTEARQNCLLGRLAESPGKESLK